MNLVDKIWQWFGVCLTILLTAVLLNTIIQRFPDAVQFFPIDTLQSSLVILIPSGIGILLYIWYDSGF